MLPSKVDLQLESGECGVRDGRQALGRQHMMYRKDPNQIRGVPLYPCSKSDPGCTAVPMLQISSGQLCSFSLRPTSHVMIRGLSLSLSLPLPLSLPLYLP